MTDEADLGAAALEGDLPFDAPPYPPLDATPCLKLSNQIKFLFFLQGVPSQNVFFKRAKNVRKSICR